MSKQCWIAYAKIGRSLH